MKTRRQLSVAEARRQICALDRSMTKLAELGGDGQDIPFEQAFSNLAHAYLRDKAPSLLDHELGFQLLDRNQENTKACGVFGFKVGSHMLYAPVFFLQGDLKGHELLYIKNQDMFVPLKENWLNYILNRKPNILGDTVGRNTAQLGVEQPDLNRLSKSPWKLAAHMPEWVQPWLPKMASAALTDVRQEMAGWDRDLNLPGFCKQARLEMLDVLVKAAQQFPQLGQAIIDHHGDLAFLHAAVKAAGQRTRVGSSVLDPPRRNHVPAVTGSVLDEAPWQHPVKTGALKVLTFDTTYDTEIPKSLSEDDRERLLRDGVLIKDQRGDDDVSIPYNIQMEQKLFNPQETGLYMVLTKEREFKKCLVAINPIGPNGRVGFATCVRVEGQHNWINCHPSRLWCSSRIEGEEYDKWYEALPDRSSLPVRATTRYMLLGPGRHTNATLPFLVTETLGDERGGKVYNADFSDYASYRYAENLLAPKNRSQAYDSAAGAWENPADAYDKWEDGQRVHLDAKDGTKIRSSKGDVWIPTGYKVLSVEPTQNDVDNAKKDDDTNSAPVSMSSSGQSQNPPLRPGNLLDATLEVFTKTAALRIIADQVSVTVGDRTMPKAAAVPHLVVVHGFREATARELLKRAAAAHVHGKAFTCRVKYAFDPGAMGDPYLTQGAPTAPGFPEPMGGDNPMGFQGPTMSSMEQAMPVPGMMPQGNEGLYNPNDVGNPMDFDTIQRAMQSGQKEVFDTAMIGSMLKAVRDDTMIDRYLPDLIKGMDRLGRILFMFYWHGDKFAERYGKQDMPELEDSLRNAFEMIGDTILFLKQKTIEPYPEEDSVALNLSEPAAA